VPAEGLRQCSLVSPARALKVSKTPHGQSSFNPEPTATVISRVGCRRRAVAVGSGLNELGGSYNVPVALVFCNFDTFKALARKPDLHRIPLFYLALADT
jgi:hypothetical protein